MSTADVSVIVNGIEGLAVIIAAYRLLRQGGGIQVKPVPAAQQAKTPEKAAVEAPIELKTGRPAA